MCSRQVHPNVMTSCGRSLGFSRLSNDCSMPPPLSLASRIRKPVLVPEYEDWTCAVTLHST
jgi:hypothetical protein